MDCQIILYLGKTKSAQHVRILDILRVPLPLLENRKATEKEYAVAVAILNRIKKWQNGANIFFLNQIPGRAMTPNRDGRERESRRGAAAARPRDLGRPIPGSSKGSNLQELELCELSSPTRVSRSSSKSNRPSRKSNSGSSSRSVSHWILDSKLYQILHVLLL